MLARVVHSSKMPPSRRRRPVPAAVTLFSSEKGDPSAKGDPAGAAHSRQPLVGIARLASISPCAEAKRGVEYYLLPIRSILNHCDSSRVPFPWTINPYRGCEFGCQYCYARYTHEYMEIDGGEFERKIYVKRDAALAIDRDLAEKCRPGEHIAIGTATDPYQPAEADFGVTRSLLDRLARREGLSLSITTKSDRIVRDLDLLRRIAARSDLRINMTVTTLRTSLARLLEPRAPRPDLRLGALEKLREAGLSAGVFAMPVLPGLTDSEEDLDRLARAAKDAGAEWFSASILFLMPSSARQFLPFLDERLPRFSEIYREWYVDRGGPPKAYREKIRDRVARLRRRYGLGTVPQRRPAPPASPQLSICFANA
ncbi:MAG TPA: radical SAM protein [Patescibacteria group bacterium]|nr:radical SAM protein [Patescibacteria group bacterium]